MTGALLAARARVLRDLAAYGLGEDPQWVCEEDGTVVAPVGRLAGWA